MRRIPLALAAAVLATACAGHSTPVASPTLEPTLEPSLTPTVAQVTEMAPARVTKVLTIVFENHGSASATQGMPYLASLAKQYGRATAYASLTHPSLPNYLAMAGGSTFSIHDDASPSAHRISGPSVFDAALKAGRSATTYAESMSTPCQQASEGRYAARHNPWTYFADSTSSCRAHDVPAGTATSGRFHTDVLKGTLPNVGLLVPNLCHDAHDCSLSTADGWLRSWMRVVLAGPDYRAGRLAVVVTFDEVEGASGGTLLTAVVSPRLHAKTVSVKLDHRSWSHWMTDLVGAAALREARASTSLGKAFGL